MLRLASHDTNSPLGQFPDNNPDVTVESIHSFMEVTYLLTLSAPRTRLCIPITCAISNRTGILHRLLCGGGRITRGHLVGPKFSTVELCSLAKN